MLKFLAWAPGNKLEYGSVKVANFFDTSPNDK